MRLTTDEILKGRSDARWLVFALWRSLNFPNVPLETSIANTPAKTALMRVLAKI